MVLYDDVSNYCDYSPPSTVSTSSTTSSSGLASPVYENVEELTGLCSRSWKRASKPSMTDFLAQIPPPPLTSYQESDRGYEEFEKRHADTSTASSSASSRRPIVGASSPSPPKALPQPLHSDAIRFDMRPLSLPHKEMQRIEREQSHRSVLIPNRLFDIPDYYAYTPACSARVLIITLLIITIFIILIALSIYVFYDDIEQHINSIADSF